MNRTGLTIALTIAAVGGLLFGIFPQLDLRIARVFYEITDSGHNMFALRLSPPLMTARNIGLWTGTVLIAPAVGALIVKFILPTRRLMMPGRAVLFLVATLALGPGLLVNVGLKDHWGRPRPIDVTEFGGDQHFVPWWDPRGDCPGNCSFVSGDVSGAFWTLAPATLAPPQWRVLAYSAALALGTVMAVLRMMAGGHFPSDTIFAGVFTFLVIWLVHALIYRWPRTRLTEESVDRSITRLAMPGFNFFTGIFRKKKTEL